MREYANTDETKYTVIKGEETMLSVDDLPSVNEDLLHLECPQSECQIYL